MPIFNAHQSDKSHAQRYVPLGQVPGIHTSTIFNRKHIRFHVPTSYVSWSPSVHRSGMVRLKKRLLGEESQIPMEKTIIFTPPENLVGGWTTHLKNMLVKLDHFPKWGWKKKLKPPTRKLTNDTWKGLLEKQIPIKSPSFF